MIRLKLSIKSNFEILNVLKQKKAKKFHQNLMQIIQSAVKYRQNVRIDIFYLLYSVTKGKLNKDGALVYMFVRVCSE